MSDHTSRERAHLYEQVSIEERFGVENLVLGQAQREPLPPQHVRLKLSYSALNYRDLMMVRGEYNPRQPLPLVPCSDGVGEVIEVGIGSSWKIGDRVIPTFSQGWLDGEPGRHVTDTTLGGPLYGTLRCEGTFHESGLVAAPQHLTDEESSTLGCAALTAWSALVELGNISTGEHVLCIGTGGVSLFGAQIAASSGARVTLISRSQSKLDKVMEHPEIKRFSNLIHPLHTPSGEPWGKRVKHLFGEVDHVLEVGGAGTLSESLRAVRSGGVISLIGVLSGGGGQINLTPVLMRQIKIQGVIVGHKAGMVRMLSAFAAHHIRPVIDRRRFELHQAPDAFAYLASAQHIGKVVIKH